MMNKETIFVKLNWAMGIKVAIPSWKCFHVILIKSPWLKLLWIYSGLCLSNGPRSYSNLIRHSHGQRSKYQVLKHPENKQRLKHLCRWKMQWEMSYYLPNWRLYQRILKKPSVHSYLCRGSNSLAPKTVFLNRLFSPRFKRKHLIFI